MNWRTKAISLAGALASALCAGAHPMSIVRGELSLDEKTVTIRLEVTDEDLAHAGIDPEAAGGIEQFVLQTSASIAIFDEGGLRFDMLRNDVLSSPEGAPAVCEIVFGTDHAWSAVTFRLVPEADGLAGGTQFQLHESESRRTLRLTTGGNTETLRAAHVESPTDDVGAWLWDGRYSGVSAVVTIEDGVVTVDVVAPIAVANSWAPLLDGRRDAMERLALMRNVSRYAEVVSGRVALMNGDAETQWGRSSWGLLRATDAQVAPGSDGELLSYWSTCVVVRLMSGEGAGATAIRWNLFNPGVQRTRVMVREGETQRTVDITSYDPVIPLVASD